MRTMEENISRYAMIDREARDLRKRLHARESELRTLIYAIGQSRPADAWRSEPVIWGLLSEQVGLRLQRLLAERGVTDATYDDVVKLTRVEFLNRRADLLLAAEQLIVHLESFGLSLEPDPKTPYERKLERGQARADRREHRKLETAARRAERKREGDIQRQQREQERRQARKEREKLERLAWQKREQRKLERSVREKLEQEELLLKNRWRAIRRNWRGTILSKIERGVLEQNKRSQANRRAWKEKQLALMKQSRKELKARLQKKIERERAEFKKSKKRMKTSAARLAKQKKRTPMKRKKRGR